MTPAHAGRLDHRSIMLHARAIEFLVKQDGKDELPAALPLLERCIAHLVDTCNVSTETATNAAITALGERTSRDCGYYIDCDKTNSFVLHLVERKTRRIIRIPVADLARLTGLS